MNKLALDIGCGEYPISLEGYDVKTVDIRPEINPDFVCNANNLFMIEDFTFDLVRASHVLEHFGRNETFLTLKEWLRVLKLGGCLTVIVPDLTWAAERIVNKFRQLPNTLDDESSVLSVLYGDQTHDENYHKMGFVPCTLRREFELLGLKNILQSIDGYNLTMTGIR